MNLISTLCLIGAFLCFLIATVLLFFAAGVKVDVFNKCLFLGLTLFVASFFDWPGIRARIAGPSA